jgi:DUF1680 family protein
MKTISFLCRALAAKRVSIPIFVALFAMQSSLRADDSVATASVPEPKSLAIKAAVAYAATPLPLADVRLTGGPLKHAEDLDAEYLLKLDPDRMLYFLRLRAGLDPKAQSGYGGWDGDGRQLTGHIAGHYLSAISYMYAATGDPRFKERAVYIVDQLKEIQDKQGDGYIGALMGGGGRGARNQSLTDGKTLFQQLSQGVIRSGGFDLNGMWSPWYVEHKIFAGLRDAYRLTGNETALEVEKKFAGWVESILAPLDEEQIQRMLATEFGGMNEVLADLYADTGEQRWLDLSDKFEHKALVNPMAEGSDVLNGKHGNTQVPKFLGDLMRYVYSGNAIDGSAARFFFEEVAFHHSFATGGHGRNEYFGRPDTLDPLLEGRTAESCNVYNMLKMAREMFALDPQIRYADFHERALFNHILASIDPATGQTSYMVPVGQGVIQEYQQMMNDFTCCVGTGMESHALHGYGIYYESPGKLWVNLFAQSKADWKAEKATVEMETLFPDGDDASLKFTLAAPKEFTLAIRRPYWAGDRFAVEVNGHLVEHLPKPDSYVEIKRLWNTGDTVSLKLPKALWLAALPDNPEKAAFMWGPLVLAGDMSALPRATPRGRFGRGGAAAPGTYPVFVHGGTPLDQWLTPVEGQPGTFKATGRTPAEADGPEREITFLPFYKMHDKLYGIYWDVVSPESWSKRAGQMADEQAKREKLAAATVAFAQPGEMQPERDFNYQAGEESQPVRIQDRPGRRAATWFSFDLPVEPSHPMALIVTYRNDEEANRKFELQVGGKKVGEQTIERPSPQEQSGFFDVQYAIPAELVKDKEKVTVRFQAADGSEVARVFGIRMIRADAQR